MSEQNILSVKEVNSYIRSLLDADTKLSNLWVRGEISNFKRHSSGHMYFTLKDSTSAIRCVMFRSRCQGLKFCPEDGMEVVAKGYVSVYDTTGHYQLYVQEMDPSGVGGLFVAFEQMKAKLKAEGLFENARKKHLPQVPSKIAVITSPTGAAVRDVLNVLYRRFPGVNILFVPAIVQGAEAPRSVIEGLDLVNRHGEAQVILLVRGGGSIEELWAFNEEAVARAVAASDIPVITGVGHETDFTIVDFVADCRAPTPSAAAEIAVPSRRELYNVVRRLDSMLCSCITRQIDRRRAMVEKYGASRVLRRPETLVSQYVQQLDNLDRRLAQGMTVNLAFSQKRFEKATGKLEVLSPLKILARGYAICRKEQEVIRDSRLVAEGDTVEIILRKGSLVCRVNKRRGEMVWNKK